MTEQSTISESKTLKIDTLGQPMTTDIFVVAGSFRQYEFLVIQSQEVWKDELKRKAVHYVYEPGILKTSKGARVFLVGSYFKRADWPRIQQAIKENGHRELLVR